MTEEKPYLNLSCFGRTENNIILCPSVANSILRLDDGLISIEEIWSYLENVQLLQKPMLDHNAIKHVIFNIQSRYDQKIRRIWNEAQFNTIEKFLLMHKSCGLCLKVVFELPQEEKPKKEELKVKISATRSIKPKEPIMERPSLRLR